MAKNFFIAFLAHYFLGPGKSQGIRPIRRGDLKNPFAAIRRHSPREKSFQNHQFGSKLKKDVKYAFFTLGEVLGDPQRPPIALLSPFH